MRLGFFSLFRRFPLSSPFRRFAILALFLGFFPASEVRAATPRAQAGTIPPDPVVDNVSFDAAAAGSYQGMSIWGSEATGAISVRLSRNGKISGRLVDHLYRVNLPFRGVVGQDGRFSLGTEIEGEEAILNLRLVKARFGGPYRLRGDFTILIAGGGVDLDLERSGGGDGFSHAGRYTVLFPTTNDADASKPRGDGYGLVTVNRTGSVRIVGAAGDATRFSSGGVVSPDGQWRFFAALYRPATRAGIGGRIVFDEQAGIGDCVGDLSWRKRPQGGDARYPTGFLETVACVGSRLAPRDRDRTILPGIPVHIEWNCGATVEFGGLPIPYGKTLNWRPGRNPMLAVPDPDRSFSFRVDRRTGLITGVFRDRASGTRLSLRGVALQSQSVAAGNFLGETESGYFVIENGNGPVLQLREQSSGAIIGDGLGLTFSNTGIDGGQAINQMEIRNTGSSNLVIHRIEKRELTGFGGQFSVINGGRANLQPGQSRYFWTICDPDSTGIQNCEFTIWTNAGTHTFNWFGNCVSGSQDAANNDSLTEFRGELPTSLAAPMSELDFFDPATDGGLYQGVLHQSYESSRKGRGTAVLRVTPGTGNFSLVVTLEGKTIRGRGTLLGGVGIFFDTFGGQDVTMQLMRAEGTGTPRVGISIGDEASGDLFRHERAPQAVDPGGYTVLLPSADHRGAESPNGNGYGTLRVLAKNRILAALVLADGTRVSHSGFVDAQKAAQIYQRLYRSQGQLSGSFVFEEEAGVCDFSGRLNWQRPPIPNSRRFPRGFEIDQPIIGSLYEPPAPGSPAAALVPGDGFVIFEYFDLGSDLTVSQPQVIVHWNERNQLQFVDNTPENPSERFRARVNVRTGLISGTYADRDDGFRFGFGGVVFNKQEIIAGHVHGHQGVFWVD